jgi:hypothetical protein
VQFDSYFIDSCADLPVDGENQNEWAKIFRYKDGWLVIWNAPIAGKDLGRWISVKGNNGEDQAKEVLKTMLRGHWNMGTVVQWDTEMK